MTIDELRGEMQGEFKKACTEMQTEFTDVRTEIKTEGETTRRHFNIMVEKVNDSVKLVAEATAHNTSRLDDHEKRLKTLQKSRRA